MSRSYPRSPFVTVEEHYERLMHEAGRKPTTVFIASFGLNIGLYRKETGEFYSKNSMTRSFLDSLRDIGQVDILLGFPGLRRGESYKDFGYRKAMLKRAMSRWPNYNWRLSKESHLKCVGFERRGNIYCVVTGGRNLTDSAFTDLSVVVSKKQREAVRNHFYRLFEQAEKE